MVLFIANAFFAFLSVAISELLLFLFFRQDFNPDGLIVLFIFSQGNVFGHSFLGLLVLLPLFEVFLGQLTDAFGSVVQFRGFGE